MRHVDLPLFDFAPLGGHGDAPADITISLASEAKRTITMIKAGHEAMGGAVVASDLIPGTPREQQIRLDVDQVLIVEADGVYYTLYAMRGSDEASGQSFISFDKKLAPPLDRALALVETRTYRAF